MSEPASIEYSDHPNFNDWLDSSSENTVNIAGYTFPPSEVLYNMKYEKYVEELEVYLADEESFLNEVYSSFPTPIAFYLWQAENNYDNPHHRLDLLKSTWEALAFFLHGLVVGEARHREIPLKDIGNNLNDYYSDRLAMRLNIIEKVLDHCEKHGFDLSCSQVISVDVISKITSLNQKRNEFAHSFAATADEQKTLYNELFPELVQALKWVRNLTHISVFRYHSNDNGGPLYPRCDLFRGYSLDGGKEILPVPRADYTLVMDYFNPQNIFAIFDSGTMFCLSPFIYFKKDPQDAHPRVALYKKKLTGGKYLFGVIGQSAQIEVEKSAFQDRDNELRTLIMGSAA